MIVNLYIILANERLQKPGGTCGCRTGGVVVEGMALVEVGRLQGAWSPTNMCDVYCCSCPMPNFKLVLQPPQVRAMFACHHRQPQYSPVPWLMLYGPDSLQACSWLNVRKNCHTDGSRVRKAQFIGCADWHTRGCKVRTQFYCLTQRVHGLASFINSVMWKSNTTHHPRSLLVIKESDRAQS